jgi:hypothetical protein
MPTENRPEEFAELVARAHHALEHAEQLEPQETVSNVRLMLRHWRYHAFLDHRSWTVFRPARQYMSQGPFIVREVVWARAHDVRRFSDPLEWLRQGYRAPPTLTVRDASMPPSDIVPLLVKLADAPVPLAGVDLSWGVDATACGFENGEPCYFKVRLQWWGDGPAEWRTFTQAVARLRQTLQQHGAAIQDETR